MILNKIYDKFSKTRTFLQEQLSRLIQKNSVDKDLLIEIESLLMQADLGTEVSAEIIKSIEKNRPKTKEETYSLVKNNLFKYLNNLDPNRELNIKSNSLCIILFLGVNGVGKTTTIAKLAIKLKNSGKKVLIAAADTFRAAAIEQIVALSEKLGVEVIKSAYKSDPSSVIFDAINAAKKRGMDILIIDTAGRFHNKEDLVGELEKMDRTIIKNSGHACVEKLLVIDANTGQNGLVQARQFHDAINITGVIVTKLDGTAKGGIIVNIERQLKIPIKLIGIGQGMEDLVDFSSKEYVESIL